MPDREDPAGKGAARGLIFPFGAFGGLLGADGAGVEPIDGRGMGRIDAPGDLALAAAAEEAPAAFQHAGRP